MLSPKQSLEKKNKQKKKKKKKKNKKNNNFEIIRSSAKYRLKQPICQWHTSIDILFAKDKLA